MVYAKNNPVIRWMLAGYVKWLVRRTFYELLFNNIETEKDKSILILANHFSFWDGLILFCVNSQLLKKRFHIMVNEQTVYKLPHLKYGGAFSINKKSREMLESINYAAELLSGPQNLIVLFPQGKLYSNFVNDIRFEKGVLKVIKSVNVPFQLVFAATFIQYYKHKKPSINVYLKTETEDYRDKTIHELKNAYQQHFDSVKKIQTEIEL